MKAFQERRLKILRVDPRYIVDLLNQATNPQRFMRIPAGEQLPEDVVVVSVNADWSSNTIELLLAHDKFEPVEVGLCAPVVGLLAEWQQVDLIEVVRSLNTE